MVLGGGTPLLSAATLARHPRTVRPVWDGTGSTFAVGDPVSGRTRTIPGPADNQCCLAAVGSKSVYRFYQ
jgi:hypothetical protein